MTDEQTAAQVSAICEGLQRCANNISLLGLYVEAGQALAGMQTIKAMWTQAHPPTEPPKIVEETSEAPKA